jgi:hypothetical protein
VITERSIGPPADCESTGVLAKRIKAKIANEAASFQGPSKHVTVVKSAAISASESSVVPVLAGNFPHDPAHHRDCAERG